MTNLSFDLPTFIWQLINLLITILCIYLVIRLFVKAGNWFYWRRKNEEEIMRKLDEVIKMQQVSPKDSD